MTSIASMTFRNLARVNFDDWRTAVDFAFVIAPQASGVRVSRIGREWAVEWRSLSIQPTYVPPVAPGQVRPYWQHPYVVTNAN